MSFLFDEPLSNLDAKLRAELRVEIKRLHQELGNNTMVYVTHDQIEALTLADRIAVMRDGVIQQLADPMTIYNQPNNMFVGGFIGSPSMNFIPGALRSDEAKLVFGFGDYTIPMDHYPSPPHGKLEASTDVILGFASGTHLIRPRLST